MNKRNPIPAGLRQRLEKNPSGMKKLLGEVLYERLLKDGFVSRSEAGEITRAIASNEKLV